MESKIKKSYKGFNKAFESGKNALIELLKKNGGFIATTDVGCDTIYGYDVFDDELTEMKVEAIRMVDYDGTPLTDYDGVPEVEVYFAPNGISKDWNWDEHTNDEWDTYFELESDGYWASLFHSEVLCVFTLYNILECVEEYI